jgi:hypothetical protein
MVALAEIGIIRGKSDISSLCQFAGVGQFRVLSQAGGFIFADRDRLVQA